MSDEAAGGEAAELDTSTALGAAGAEEKPADDNTTALGEAGKPADADAKPADAAEGDDKGEGEGDDDAKAEGAPEEYADFTMPEGMEVDKKSVERFTPVFKDMNFSQEQAQKLVDVQAQLVQEAQEAQIQQWNETRTNWLETARSDPEIGGDKFDGSLHDAGVAIRKYGTPELVQAFDELGIGNHPEIMRFVARVGKDLGEDTVRGGRSPAVSEKSVAQRLYPSMK